jgi:hypothetical protein
MKISKQLFVDIDVTIGLARDAISEFLSPDDPEGKSVE